MKIKKIHFTYFIWILFFVSTLLLYALWANDYILLVPTSYDSLYYHQAHIRWNEEYPVVPGLANLEDRFGFNSNYLLISALFTFRFLFDNPVYAVQSAVAVIVFLWIVSEIAKCGFDAKRVVLIALYFFFVFLFKDELNLTSTDIVPNLLVFYLGARIVLYPQQIKNSYFLYTVLCVYVVTLKLSYALLGISTIFIVLYLLKIKCLKDCFILIAFCLAIIVPWLGRNVMLSGYLIYPLYQLDLFSVDWKVPLEIAMRESDYIVYYAKRMYIRDILVAGVNLHTRHVNFWHFITLVIAALSFIICTILMVIKRKVIPSIYWIIYILIGIGAIYVLKFGPSLRFVIGLVFTLILLLTYIITEYCIRKKEVRKQLSDYKLYNLSMMLVIAVFVVYLFGNSFEKIDKYKNILMKYSSLSEKEAMKRVLINQFSSKESLALITQKEKEEKGSDLVFKPYILNNGVIVYISGESSGILFDIIPSTPTLPSEDHWTIFQCYENLEGRGATIQDGFRSRIIGNNILNEKRGV